MQLGAPIAEGKTKIIYLHPHDPNLVVICHKDGITAGDGARRNEIPGKGAIAGRTTANVFAYLEREGIATHYVDAPSDDMTVAQRCAMLPLEVVMRRLATGSYLRRHPEIAEGHAFEPPLVEFFFKDDAAHDPQISEAEIIERGLASPAEVEQMINTGRAVCTALARAWAAQDVTLVDIKIEFGRSPNGQLIVADVIDNDSWRIWPGGEKARMLDKQVYRNASEVDADLLAAIKDRYQQVADMTAQF
ncbi:Phosphoribosylaminoimidazolesuccinocarboxamide synthase [Oscillochloris trichoides DG-6]|uniref:Phosphoribosylaminoimidazole-succinocarboxamide synthase n=1 Tax=Oscillochloris trichoides DG-6 TaxID=765420 RepID=E1IC30_9CHLR|nr:phosphoribosylaminoimidazolesuccinocarboxamide synthase [Oscillochloris trichoides]EFO81292.1 Phosphoribosylaminoimidazolesuccinocarboxamide synthase [Oscillochloris trichoides DG-6]